MSEKEVPPVQIVQVDLATARAQFSKLVGAIGEGQTFVITRYGKPVAELGPTTTTAQMEHIAAAPTHRPAPERPVHRAQTVDDILRGTRTKGK